MVWKLYGILLLIEVISSDRNPILNDRRVNISFWSATDVATILYNGTWYAFWVMLCMWCNLDIAGSVVNYGSPKQVIYHSLPLGRRYVDAIITHYNNVIMGAIASHITSLTIVYSIVYSEADQRKHQSSASLFFVRGIHRGQVNSPHKWPVTRKMFPFDDVIKHHGARITSSRKDKK